MKILTEDNFNALLNWFSPDQKEAGEKYEEIRNGLIKFFEFRGCNDPASLSDETITRVANRLSTLNDTDKVKTITLFYGFAKNIYFEYRTKFKHTEVELDTIALLADKSDVEADYLKELTFKCLEDCLNQLPLKEKDLLLEYYSRDKQEKFELRKNLANKLKMKKGTLHTKIHRSKLNLKKCMEKCMEEKKV